jgi:predicted dehydrogenase
MAFRWGILGLGNIARSFANGLKSVPEADLYAVGSRSQEKAEKFGAEFGATRRYGSYQALADDPNVDAIYIATPHPSHAADSLLALDAGKATLTEKPFTINAAEARSVVTRSQEKNVFLMEAMWTRFTPVMVQIRELISEGAIGEVRIVEADFGFHAGFDPASRLFNPELGGGALLDVGVYTISLASMLLGTPVEVTGLAHLGESGVDEESAFVFKYQNGALANLSTAIRVNTAHTALIYGTSGRIAVESPWWNPRKFTLYQNGKDPEVLTPETIGNGYNYEAIEVDRCVREGKIESEVLPHSETISILETMDKLRAQWGLVYPQEVK